MSESMSFEDLRDRVAGTRITLVAGISDTGKSTLVRRLADDIHSTVVDSDIGQSDMGPPSVVSLGYRREGRFHMTDGYFVGSVTPARHFLQLLAGVSRMVTKCERFPLIINTTGLATGGIGRTLLTEKINSVLPDLIITISTDNELSYLDAFQKCGIDIVNLKPGPDVRDKSRAERNLLRARAFKEHFEGSEVRSIKLEDIGIERSLLNNGDVVNPGAVKSELGFDAVHVEISGDEAIVVFKDRIPEPETISLAFGTKVISAYNTSDFQNLLVGINGPDGKFGGLGIVKSIDFGRKEIEVMTCAKEYSIIQFGTMKLDPVSFNSAGQFRPAFYRA
ncbi:Clp1/GlmU family protein [Methanocella sp. MCL-LM]|uniref:Clp1/GlmU family protein n=1 Tax=Methanocella sp. MCL-LM TaxID=3412035 RepID=UPI003C7080AE